MREGLIKPEYLALIEDFGSNTNIQRPSHGTKFFTKSAPPQNKFFLRADYSMYKSFANKESEARFLEEREVIVKEIPDCTQ